MIDWSGDGRWVLRKRKYIAANTSANRQYNDDDQNRRVLLIIEKAHLSSPKASVGVGNEFAVYNAPGLQKDPAHCAV